jgi:DNA-binding transcriptional regulator YhcF (GntR family)
MRGLSELDARLLIQVRRFVGKDTPRLPTLKNLADHLGVERRAVERSCQHLRSLGYPVLSQCGNDKAKGIYYGQCAEDVDRYSKQIRSRAAKMFFGIRQMSKAMKARIKQEAEQLELEL